MATKQRHNTYDNFRLTLSTGISSTDTAIVVDGDATAGPTVPFILRPYGGSEKINVTAATTDTLTATRGYDGTAASAYITGTMLDLEPNSTLEDEKNTWFDRLEKALVLTQGGGNRVLRWEDGLEVVAQGTPDMTVQVSVGWACVSNHMAMVETAEDTSAITAPTGNPRIDVVQISQYGVISIVTGVEGASPSAPSVSANNIKLAEIYCRVGMTSIKDTDDSTNGYITDARVFTGA